MQGVLVPGKFIERIGRLITRVIGLALMALIPVMALGAAAPKPGLPEVLSFRLEDGRHGTPGLTLSFALPAVLKYECRRIVFRADRRNRDILITLLDVEPTERYDNCRLAKEPAPIRERIMLPPEPGDYRLVFASGKRRDVYALALRQDSVTLDATGNPAFTRCEQTGKLKRVGPRWLWTDFSYLTVESFREMKARRNEMLDALEAIGAKPFAPSPGRYLLDGFVRQIPAAPSADANAKEEYFFLWDGDWEALRKLADRYKSYATVDSEHPVMILWLSSRDKVVSTVGGFVNSFY
jgi:hypothetical protein